MNQGKKNQQFSLDELQIKLIITPSEKKKKNPFSQLFYCFDCDSDDDDSELDQNQQFKQSFKNSVNQSYMFDGAFLKKKNELVILGNLKEGDVCLMRITQRNFLVEMLQNTKQPVGNRRFTVQNSPLQSYQTTAAKGNLYFSQFMKGIKINIHDYYNALPEKVYRYLALRAKIEGLSGVFVDGICEHGAGLIFFGLTGIFHLILGADKQSEHLKSTLHNTDIYDIQVDLLKSKLSDLSFLPSIKPSLLFLKPDYIYHESSKSEDFSLIEHLSPNINVVLENSFRIARNVILVLPKYTRMDELAQFIGQFLVQNNNNTHKVEVQVIQIDGIIQHYVLYLGSIANVKDQDEYEYLAITLLSDSSLEERIIPCLEIIHLTAKSIGFQKTLILIGKAKARALEIATETILSIFLNMLVKENIITRQIIREKFQTEDLANLLNGTPIYKIEQNSSISQELYSSQKKRTFSRAQCNYPSFPQKIREDINWSRNSLYQRPIQQFSFQDENS